MANFNKVILAGNLTRDPELRYTPKGTAVAKIGMAINRVWRNEAGETKEEVTFVDVDAFGRTAENIGKYLKKGRPILIEGRLKYETWEDKQTNQKRSKLGVIAETFQFIDSKPDFDGSRGSSGPSRAPTAPPPEPSPESEPPPVEDDVPF